MPSLPNLIIFEGHTDPIAKRALIKLFKPLAEMGYGSFCLETPSDLSLEQCLEYKNEVCKTVVDFLEQAKPLLLEPSVKQDATERGIPYHDSVFENISIESLSEKYSYIELTTLLNQYVTTKYYEKFARLIKGYKADLCFIDMMKMIDPRMSVDFIDLPMNKYNQFAGRAALHLEDQDQRIFESIEARDQLFFDAISRINQQGKPVVFLCGTAHAKGLLQHIRAAGNAASPVVFKFLHSHENIMSLAHPRPEVIMAQFLDHETGMDTTPFRHYLDDDIKLEDFVNRLLTELQGSIKEAKGLFDKRDYNGFSGRTAKSVEKRL